MLDCNSMVVVFDSRPLPEIRKLLCNSQVFLIEELPPKLSGPKHTVRERLYSLAWNSITGVAIYLACKGIDRYIQWAIILTMIAVWEIEMTCLALRTLARWIELQRRQLSVVLLKGVLRFAAQTEPSGPSVLNRSVLAC